MIKNSDKVKNTTFVYIIKKSYNKYFVQVKKKNMYDTLNIPLT